MLIREFILIIIIPACVLHLQEREKKKAAKGSSKSAAKGPPQPTLEDFVQNAERPVPLFLEKCVSFIEVEGLDSEGIYRVPGNKVHVEQLTTKFKEGMLQKELHFSILLCLSSSIKSV